PLRNLINSRPDAEKSVGHERPGMEHRNQGIILSRRKAGLRFPPPFVGKSGRRKNDFRAISVESLCPVARVVFAQYQPFDDQSLARAAQSEIDLTSAVVFAPADFSGPENKAVQMLIEEVERRTQIRWQRVAKAPTDGT